MRAEHLGPVVALADAIHPSLPEDVSVFRNRLTLYPQGCFVLIDDDAGGGEVPVLGYAVGHPWRGDAPPKLNTILDALPDDPDRFYIHDVVVSPAARGCGHAMAVVGKLLERAEAFPAAILVSVYGTPPFWSRFGFIDASGDVSPSTLAAYGPDACFMIRRHSK